jgi:SAM-dependent methyltransferase
MPLLPLARIHDFLACPRCRSNVMAAQSGLRCANVDCGLSIAGAFPQVDRWPVLVDFATSVLDLDAMVATQAQSVVPRGRRSRWLDALKQALFAPNDVAGDNLQRLKRELPQGERSRVLIVGGGGAGHGAEILLDDARIDLIAFDIYGTPLTQFIADGHRIPLADGSVDAVVIQAVLEHVLDPAQVVAEIHRVLAADGIVYAETPFLQQVHEGPYDFTRFTESGHRYLFRRFTLLDSGVIGGPGTQLLWSIDYAARGLFRSRLAGGVTKALFFWVRVLDRLCPYPYAVDSASGCYFLGRRSEQEMTPRDIIEHYRGAQIPRNSA